MARFDERWANVNDEYMTTMRILLTGVLTAPGRRTLEGGIRADMIARGGMLKDDLLDFAHDLVGKDAYWERMPAEVKIQTDTLRSDIRAITDKRQSWR